MALRSGQTGYIFVAAAIPTDRWSANWRARDAEVTQSDAGGCSLYFPIVQDNEWEWTAARDDASYPEAIGLASGTIITSMYFKMGAGTKADRLQNTLVTDVAPVVDTKGDVVRVTVRGKGGLMTANQTSP